MNRRDFIGTAAACAAWACAAPRAQAGASADGVAPSKNFPRVLYSNDATNLTTCDSPFHKRGEPFAERMIDAAVDETTGLVDAHFLQPGYGWVPWWNSESYPAAEHYRWFEKRYGVKPDGWGAYFLGGGDLAAAFVRRCRLRNQSPFLSLRLNDGHLKEGVESGDGRRMQHTVSRFYEAHWREWRIGKTMARWGDRVLNWAVPEVRAHKFQFLKELCAYDIDGLELDFMRDFTLFRLDETTVAERVGIVTEFVRRVRAMMDARGRALGRRLRLCVRIPAFLKFHEFLGLSLPDLAAAGVDMAVVSSSYFTAQRHELAAMCACAPSIKFYLEMTHAVARGARLEGVRGYDDCLDRRATPEMLATTAHVAYAQGASGVSYFNFPYYRAYGDARRGPFSEPPFLVLPLTGDPARLAKLPQYYLWTSGWQARGVPQVFPYPLSVETPLRFAASLAAPEGGRWKSAGRLRAQCAKAVGARTFAARLNGAPLEASPDVSEPYPNPYTQCLGTPATLRAWRVPPEILRDGENEIELECLSGESCRIEALDLTILS